MTKREAYVRGWVYGRIIAVAPNLEGNLVSAAMRPCISTAEIITKAHKSGIVTRELDRDIGQALCEIPAPLSNEDDIDAYAVIPIDQQGSWQLGYYAGLAGKPLSPDTFDVAAARKAKGLTQAQLAKMVGVEQSMVSHWETGRLAPSKEKLKKLREIFSGEKETKDAEGN